MGSNGAVRRWEESELFGEYLVAPLEKVLFFDFYSGPRTGSELGADGQPEVAHDGDAAVASVQAAHVDERTGCGRRVAHGASSAADVPR